MWLSTENLRADPWTSEAAFYSLQWEDTRLGPSANWDDELRRWVRFMLGSTHAILLIWGADRVLLFNRAYSQILGERWPEVLGASAPEIWAPIWPQIKPYVDDMFAGNSGCLQNQPIPSFASGFTQATRFSRRYSPVLNASGQVEGGVVFAIDETEQIEERERVAAELAHLRRLLENAVGFVAMTEGPNHLLTYTNEAFKKMVYSRPVLGLPIAEALPELVEQRFIDTLDRVFQTGEPFSASALPVRLQQAPGEPQEQRYVDAMYQPLRNEAGEIIGVFGEGHDVTEHIEALRQLAEAERIIREKAETFRKTLDHIPQMVWSTRPDGYHDYYSASWYEFTGMPEGATDGEGWNDMFHPDDQARAWKLWRHSLVTGEPYEIQYRLRHHSGEYRHVLGRAWPQRGAEGEIVRWYGTCTDIDEQVRAQETIEKLQAELTHLARLRAMDSMAATLAHEVNQPLGAAANFAAALQVMVKQKRSDEASLISCAKQVQDAVLRAGEIIRRIRKGTLRHAGERVLLRVDTQIEEALLCLDPLLLNDVRLEMTCDAGARVFADPIALQQVLVNLIRNAVEALEGRPTRELTISAATQGPLVQFSIEDDGPGFSKDQLDDPFSAFSSTKQDGVGVGLSISRTIVEAQGGKIWARNRPGGGAGVHFQLPAAG